MEDQNKPQSTPSTSSGSDGSGVPSNIAALLCYICWPVLAVVFYLLDKKNDFVRLHAINSLLLGAVVFVVWLMLLIMGGILSFISVVIGTLLGIVQGVLILTMIAVAILSMVKAYQNTILEIPFITEQARKFAAK